MLTGAGTESVKKHSPQHAERCDLAAAQLKVFSRRTGLLVSTSRHVLARSLKRHRLKQRQRQQRYAAAFFEAFSVWPAEVVAVVCHSCFQTPHNQTWLEATCSHKAARADIFTKNF